MGEDKKRSDQLDSFWDLSKLVPEKKIYRSKRQDITLAEIDSGNDSASNNSQKLTFNNENIESVIRKDISPRIQSDDESKYTNIISYSPENSLIHQVVLKKKKCVLEFYEDFVKDAKRYLDYKCSKSDYVPFFSYVPQYNQLNRAQLNYYLWWRDSVRNGIFENTDYSYILLYVFELINIADSKNARECQMKLTDVWNAYAEKYPMLSGKLLSWICDLSLIHRLSPPVNMTVNMVSSTHAFKEFFIPMPNGDFDLCAESLLKYSTSYDYTTSKFAVGDNRKIYDKYIKGALRCAVDFYSENGKILSKLSAEDSGMTREAFAGALCSNQNRYTIDIKYCSFSRSNELRFLIGDIIKYAENKIRMRLGIKSKLTVYSVTNELKNVIDQYFDNNFTDSVATGRKPIVHEYDALYDVPRKKLSLSDAMRIENDSWDTTNDLVSAFEEVSLKEEIKTDSVAEIFEEFEEDAESMSQSINGDGELAEALGELYSLAVMVKNCDGRGIDLFVANKNKMLDALIDEINEIAVEVIGDILIEENDAGFCVIDCYKDML